MNLFDSTTQRRSLSELKAEAPEVTVDVTEDDIVSAEDLELEELEVTRETLRLDAETRRASPELVGHYLSRAERDPADELEFDRELDLPPPEPPPARVVDTPAASAPTLDDLLDDALQKCLARQVSEAMQKAIEPPPICDPPQALQPRVGRSRSRIVWSTLAVIGGTVLGVGLAAALLRFLG